MEHIDTGLVQFGPTYRMVISSGEKMISITKRQFSFLKNFLTHGDIDEAAKNVGVERKTVVGWFKNSNFRQFLKERLQYAADRNGCTFDWSVSELKGLWEGKRKKNKVQMDAMKEINRMLGFVKEIQGGVNAREFINAEYVVIQKAGPINVGPEFAQISRTGRSVPSQICLSDVRETVGEVNFGGMEGDKGDQPTAFNGVVSKQPVEAGQGHNLDKDAPDVGTMQESIQSIGNEPQL